MHQLVHKALTNDTKCGIIALINKATKKEECIISTHNTNYSIEQVSEILEVIQSLVRDNKYSISMNPNRQENREFVDEYNIRDDKKKRILLDLKAEDFCYSVNNIKEGYEHEILYVFAP